MSFGPPSAYDYSVGRVGTLISGFVSMIVLGGSLILIEPRTSPILFSVRVGHQSRMSRIDWVLCLPE